MSVKVVIDADNKVHAIRRQYKGVVVTAENYRELIEKGGRNLVNFHNKHLRAYSKGDKTFVHGYETVKGRFGIKNRIPKVYTVDSNIYLEEIADVPMANSIIETLDSL